MKTKKVLLFIFMFFAFPMFAFATMHTDTSYKAGMPAGDYVGHDLGYYPIYFSFPDGTKESKYKWTMYKDGIHFYPVNVAGANGPSSTQRGDKLASSTYYTGDDNVPTGYHQFDSKKIFDTVDKDITSESWQALSDNDKAMIDKLGAMIVTIMAGPDGNHSIQVFDGGLSDKEGNSAVAALVMGYVKGYFKVNAETGYTYCPKTKVSTSLYGVGGTINFMTNSAKTNQYIIQILSYVDMYMHWVKTGKPKDILMDTRVGDTCKEVLVERYPEENLHVTIPEEYPSGEVSRTQVKTLADVGINGSSLSPDMYLTGSIDWLHYEPACYECTADKSVVKWDSIGDADTSCSGGYTKTDKPKEQCVAPKACYQCKNDSTKYKWGTSTDAGNYCSGEYIKTDKTYDNCKYIAPVKSCYECVVDGKNKYTKAFTAEEASTNTNGGTSCKVVKASYCEITPVNPKTGNVFIIIAWIITIGTLGYVTFYTIKNK